MIDVVTYYHDAGKVPLLRGAVLPAVADLAARGFAVHVERHWLHGPHVRVRIAPTEHSPADPGPAADEVADHIRAYLADHPSQSTADDATLLADADRLGRAELVAGPYEPIHPDNSVHIVPTDHGRLAALLKFAHLPAHRDAVLRLGVAPIAATVDYLADAGERTSPRVTVTLAAMAAHASNFPTGIGSGYQSFLSHLKDYLTYDDPDGTSTPIFDKAWRDNGDAATALVRAIATGGDLPAALAPVVDAWRAWSRAAWELTDAATDAESLTTPGTHHETAAGFGGDTAERWDFGRRRFSDYHHALNTSGRTDFFATKQFGVYRFCTNMLYQLLLVADVRPVERYLAAHLISNATQAITGRTWRQQIGAPVGQGTVS